MKDNHVMLLAFISDRGKKNFKIVGPPVTLKYNAGLDIIIL